MYWIVQIYHKLKILIKYLEDVKTRYINKNVSRKIVSFYNPIIEFKI